MLESLTPRPHRPLTRRGQRGASLIELLVSMGLGLLLLAVCAGLFLNVLREHRAALHEARLMQDLRTASDIVTRDLRRAGHWGAAAQGTFWTGHSVALRNPYSAQSPASAVASAATFRYSQDAEENNQLDAAEEFGVRLRNGAIDLMLGQGNWQSLTDAGTLRIHTLRITPTVDEVPLAALCHRPCPASAADCPPRQWVRSVQIDITGASTQDASIERSLRSRVRVRNDTITGRCPP